MTGSKKLAARPGTMRARIACFIWTGVVGITVLVVTRRLSGQLNVPGTSLPAIAAAFTGAALALSACILFCSARRTQRMRLSGGLALGAATILPQAILGASLLPTGSIFGATVLSLLFVVVSASMLAAADFGSALDRTSTKPRCEPYVVQQPRDFIARDAILEVSASGPAEAAAELRSVILESALEPLRGPDLAQTVNRIRLPDRGETATGTVSVRLAANQRLATIHLPFVPAFPGRPEVVCRLADGSKARLHIADVKPYGARVELKRAVGEQPEQLLELHFTAAMPSPRSDAA